MGLKINNIIVLENEERYIVLKEVMYYGKKYFLTMGVNEKNDVVVRIPCFFQFPGARKQPHDNGDASS